MNYIEKLVSSGNLNHRQIRVIIQELQYSIVTLLFDSLFRMSDTAIQASKPQGTFYTYFVIFYSLSIQIHFEIKNYTLQKLKITITI